MFTLAHFNIRRLIKKIEGLQKARVLNQPSEDALNVEIQCYLKLAALYGSLVGKKKYPYAREMSLECYATAASLDDATAQYILGKALLEEAQFREDLQTKGLFASNNNERRMQHLYEEAHVYLIAAQKLNHIEAKRLLGLAYINGWGVAADRDKGFALIVESINQESSWDRVPQIFAAIGLNKPEFFSALMQHRKDSP